MAEQGTSAPTEIATSETPALPEPLSLDDLSPAQAQRVLEAALQHYCAGDKSRVVDTGTSTAVPSLTNAGPTTPLTASGEQQRGQVSLLNMPASCRVTGRIRGLLTRGGPARPIGIHTPSITTGYRGTGRPACCNGIGMPASFRGIGMPASFNGIGMPASFNGIGTPASLSGIGMPASLGGIGTPASFSGIGMAASFKGIGTPASFSGIGMPASLNGIGMPTSFNGIGTPASFIGIGRRTVRPA